MSKSSKKHKQKNRQAAASAPPIDAKTAAPVPTPIASASASDDPRPASGPGLGLDAKTTADGLETRDISGASDQNAAATAIEPLTPERAAEWNRYYDFYVTAFVLALIFLVSSNLISDSSIWSHLAMGREASARSAPATQGVGSLTKADQPWVNIPWTFEWTMFEVHRAVKDSASIFGPSLTWLSGMPYKERLPNAKRIWDEHLAAGALIVVNALLMTVAAWLLMRIRHPGPGLWWSAVCVAIALGGTVFPIFEMGPTQGDAPGAMELSGFALLLGGIGGPSKVDPTTWGVLLLAIELTLLHRAWGRGSRGALWGLVPVFLIWANVHESFVIGVLLFGLATVGEFFRKAPEGEGEGAGGNLSRPMLIALALSAAATLLNPALVGVWPAAIALISDVPIFGATAERSILPEAQRGVQMMWMAANLLALGSFALNLSKFNVSRFLMFLGASVLFAISLKTAIFFAPVWAVVMALNGQEWHLGSYGEKTSVGTAAQIWSTGGRGATIIAVFAMMVATITGWSNNGLLNLPVFGFGIDRDRMSFDAAEHLRDNPLASNLLNTNASQGDVLLWKGEGKIKVYYDSRPGLYDRADFETLNQLRTQMVEDDPKIDDLLKEHGVSAVMIPVGYSSLPPRFRKASSLETWAPKTYAKLSVSPRWSPFYDDGNIVLFGRVQDPAAPANPIAAAIPDADRERFNNRRLDSDTMVYKQKQDLLAASRPPTPVTWIDRYFPRRFQIASQPMVLSAERWMGRQAMMANENDYAQPTPADCIMAIRSARQALARDPDDPLAYKSLAKAYYRLLILESALLAGIELKPENAAQIDRVGAQHQLLPQRFRQYLTALHYAIQTTPPPDSDATKADLSTLHFQMFQAYQTVGFLDLGLEHLRKSVDLAPPEDVRDEVRELLKQLDELVAKNEADLNERLEQQNLNQMQQASESLNLGLTGKGVSLLEEAYRLGMNPNYVNPFLLDLYCQIGQPDRASNLLGQQNEPTLSSGPGTAALRQGLVSLLLGDYANSSDLWNLYAIPDMRNSRNVSVLMEGLSSLKGELLPIVSEFSSQNYFREMNTQGGVEMNLALLLLEAGDPERAGEHFENALKLVPEMTTRPLAAYYLTKLGRQVPPASANPPAPAPATAPMPTTPPAAKSELPENVFAPGKP